MFTLGASQLALVLGGPAIFLIAMLLCPSLFVFFLFKVKKPGSRSLKQFARPYLFSTVFLLVGNFLYLSTVFLRIDLSQIIFVCLHILLFIIPPLISIPFLRKASNVS
jgi:hypothetical protein